MLRTGYLKAIQYALRVQADELVSFGLPCTLFIFMNSPTHQRSEESPYGDVSKQYIVQSNVCPGKVFSWLRCVLHVHASNTLHVTLQVQLRVTSRTVTLLMLLSARAVYWLLEQPSSSKVIHYPELRYLLDMLDEKVMETSFTRLRDP